MIYKNFTHSDWRNIHLVCFDVDGTLYDQRRLRLLMMREMLIEATLSKRVKFIQILRKYRSLRENSESLSENFEQIIISKTAHLIGCKEEDVNNTVIEWIHKRPLRYLRQCRYAGVSELFFHIKEQGKKIGIFSDYSAAAKLLALGLSADYVACAGDNDTPRLKPDPQGLLNLMAKSGAGPTNTLLIGDRADRDGLAAQRAGSFVLIRSRRKINEYQTFENYTDSIFSINP